MAGTRRRPILADGMLVAPIPLHHPVAAQAIQPVRLLSAAFAAGGPGHCPDLLVRDKATPKLDGKKRDAGLIFCGEL